METLRHITFLCVNVKQILVSLVSAGKFIIFLIILLVGGGGGGGVTVRGS